MRTLVMKFGGASVATTEQFSDIADIILERRKLYDAIVVVVSAMGNTTDQLISLAKQVNENPPRREYDMLVSVGERISISLLAMALAKKDLRAVSFTGSQSGIITCDKHSDARILEVKPHRLLPHLNAGCVVIVAGFQGVSKNGEITTLGRGGSDTSAVALGVALSAEVVEFFKDVPGIFSADPKLDQKAVLHKELSYEQMYKILEQGGKVLQKRSVCLAERNQIPLHVLSFQEFKKGVKLGTFIGSSKERTNSTPQYEDNANE